MSAKNHPERDWIATARTLAEALPYLQRYTGAYVVIKFGGHAMGDARLMQAFAKDMALMKLCGIHPIIVHGGGPQIGALLERLQIQSEFVDGLRTTDEATIEVVEMVLSGKINKEIVAAINTEGGRAIGISGKDANLIVAKKLERRVRDPLTSVEKTLDIGFVGTPARVNPEMLRAFSESGYIPVIAPVAAGEEGQTYNINADAVAGAIAGALKARRLLLLTDVPGVKGTDGEVMSSITRSKANEMIAAGTISGGMIPKVQTALDALNEGARGAVILDGRARHACLLELFTEHGAGTLLQG